MVNTTIGDKPPTGGIYSSVLALIGGLDKLNFYEV
jgi:hypothetical protein